MLKVISVLLFVFTGCSAAEQAQESGEMSRKLNYQVTASSRAAKVAGTYLIEREDNLDSEAEYVLVEKYLDKQGLKKVEKNPTYMIKAEFELKEPVLGISIGTINPYVHTLTIKAKDQAAKPIWQVKVKGESEYQERGQILPFLLVAADGFVGKTTATEKTIPLQDSDKRLKDYE